MKQEAVARLDLKPGQFVSTQDVLSGWIAGLFRSKYLVYIVNIRGRCPGVDPRAMTNGEMLWSVLISAAACSVSCGVEWCGGCCRCVVRLSTAVPSLCTALRVGTRLQVDGVQVCRTSINRQRPSHCMTELLNCCVADWLPRRRRSCHRNSPQYPEPWCRVSV